MVDMQREALTHVPPVIYILDRRPVDMFVERETEDRKSVV